MLQILLVVIGAYALAALSVHLFYWLSQGRKRIREHYVLVANEKEQCMEWYMRSFYAFSRWTGKDIKVTVVGRGASAETIAIVDRLSGDAGKVAISDDEELQGDGLLWQLQSRGIVAESEQAVLVDLQSPADLSKLPF